MKIKFLLLALFGLIKFSYGQVWQPIASVRHTNLDCLTTDRLGNIYVSNTGGAVTKYTQDGKLLLEYAPIQQARIQKIGANSQIKVVLFYENLQEFKILDRYLSFPVNYRLDDFGLGFVEHLATNSLLAIWVLDISDFSLKLIDLRDNRLMERKSLAKVLNQELANIRSFHSHQNRLYLVEENTGVQVFDNIGNHLFKLTDIMPGRVGFDKDYMYYLDDGVIKFVHLYEGEPKSVELPDVNIERIEYSNGHLIAITDLGFNIYKYLSAD